MKMLIISLGIVLLCACATTSDVKDIEQKVSEGLDTVELLKNKIDYLEVDRSELSKQLLSIDSNGQSMKSEAIALRGKISVIDQSIGKYQNEIKVINSSLSVVKKQQKSQHQAATIAVKENEALKIQAIEEIKALEFEYEQKRLKANEDKNENNGGG